MKTKLKVKKKKRVVNPRRRHMGYRVKELLKEKGKTEKWLADELKRIFKINKYETKEVLDGKRLLSLTTNGIPFCSVLGVSTKTLYRDYL